MEVNAKTIRVLSFSYRLNSNYIRAFWGYTAFSHTKASAQTFFNAAQTSVGVCSGLGR